MATPRNGNPEGRRPKPQALKLLHGDVKKATDPRPASAVTGEVVKPALSPAGSAEWDRIAPDMIAKGVLTEWDVGLFAEWCESLVLVRAARVRAAQELTGAVVVGPSQTSPMATYSRALINCMALASRFGLTPSDRARLVAAPEANHASRADLIS